MKLQNLYNILDEISPFELQESWDNSGLQVGDLKSETGEIFIALDLDEALLLSLPENATLLTHHPLIFKPLKSVDFSRYPAKFIQMLITKNINLISLHTNYDKTHLNRYVAQEVLGWQEYIEEDFIITKKLSTTFSDLLSTLKEKFSLESIKYTQLQEKITRVALTTGAGASMAKNIDADVHITGDVKYHDAMEAKAVGVSLIDITHYASERFFAQSLCDQLKTYNINGIIRDLHDPFNQK